MLNAVMIRSLMWYLFLLLDEQGAITVRLSDNDFGTYQLTFHQSFEKTIVLWFDECALLEPQDSAELMALEIMQC